MPDNKSQKSTMMALGVIFTLIALVALVALLRLKSLADTIGSTNTTETANVSNQRPTLDTIQVLDAGVVTPVDVTQTGFTPNEGLARDLMVKGTIADANGFADFDNVAITVARSDFMNLPIDATQQLGATAPADNNHLYVATANITQIDATHASFQTIIPVMYYADPTDSVRVNLDWQALAVVTDKSGAFGSNHADFEMNSLAAFTVSPTTINYGVVALGDVSGQKTVRFYNDGNRDDNALVRANQPMVSSLGSSFDTIPVENTHYQTQDTLMFQSASSVTTGETPDLICVPQQTDDAGTPPSRVSFFSLKMPSKGVNGTYTNTLTFTAAPTTDCNPGIEALSQQYCLDHSDDPECIALQSH